MLETIWPKLWGVRAPNLLDYIHQQCLGSVSGQGLCNPSNWEIDFEGGPKIGNKSGAGESLQIFRIIHEGNVSINPGVGADQVFPNATNMYPPNHWCSISTAVICIVV